MDMKAMLAAKKAFTPEDGFNVVGVDTFENDPEDQLYLVDNVATRAEAEALVKARKAKDSSEVLHIYGSDGKVEKSLQPDPTPWEKAMLNETHGLGATSDFLEKGDDGKPGESLGETDTKELKATLEDIRHRLKTSDDEGLQRRAQAIAAELKRRGNMGKSESFGLDAAGDFLEKAGVPTGLPSGDKKGLPPPANECSKEEEGGKLEGTGKTPDSTGSSSGPAVGAPGSKKEKFSEDDDEVEKQLKGGEPGMVEQKPPIKKSLAPEGYTLQEGVQQMRYERDQALKKSTLDEQAAALVAPPEVDALESELQKSTQPPAQVEPVVARWVNPDPAGIVQYELSKSDAECCAALDEGAFYADGGPGQVLRKSRTDETTLCKSCGHEHLALLTACDNCGAGQVLNRTLPPEFGPSYLEKGGTTLNQREPEPEVDFSAGIPTDDE